MKMVEPKIMCANNWISLHALLVAAHATPTLKSLSSNSC